MSKSLHIPGTPGASIVQAGNEVMQAAFNAAQQKYGDDPAQAEMFINLAFGWLYYILQKEVSVEALVQSYGRLKAASPRDIADLQTRLARFEV